MTQEEMTEFAKLIAQYVRDLSIKACDVELYSDNMRSPIARRWREAKTKGDIDKMGEMIIQDSVDTAIFYFLELIDYRVLNVSFKMPDNKTVDITGNIIGELGGWYMGEWRSTYSEERCPDDFEGL